MVFKTSRAYRACRTWWFIQPRLSGLLQWLHSCHEYARSNGLNAALNGVPDTKTRSLIQSVTAEHVRVRLTQPSKLQGRLLSLVLSLHRDPRASEPSVPLLRFPWTWKVDRPTEMTAGGQVYYGAASFKTRAPWQNKEAFEASENGP